MNFIDRIAEEIRLIEERNDARKRLADYLKELANKKGFGRLEQRTLRHLQFRFAQTNEALEQYGRVAI